MGLPGRTSLARILLLSVVLSGLPLAAAAAEPTRAQAHGTKAAAATPTARRAPARHVRRDGFVPGRVLVRFAARAGEPDRRAAVATVDGTVMAGSGRTRVVRLERGADVRAAARRLADRPGVASAEPDWLRRVDDCDPDVCWHLQPNQGAEHGANVVAAHDAGATGTGRTVAVVDTGVVTGVADLAGRVSQRLRCTDTGCVPAVATPTSSHGTEVASVVAALDNTTGTTGVAPGATVVSYRVDSSGAGIPSPTFARPCSTSPPTTTSTWPTSAWAAPSGPRPSRRGSTPSWPRARPWSPRPATPATASPSTRPPSPA
jgi:hypothetical protein